ncbi:MAG: Rrf2 family transcriptional regulator [Verrucomicrobia bacterium]|nr:Rrf2 family transcriptional regulator [Verrucomicrobiota bacterium]
MKCATDALELGIIRYGKTARQGVAALSYLAEVYASDGGAVTSAEVGKARGMPQALAAKLLSEASSAGLVIGTTGPGGGYRLARDPAEITLADIVWIYERKQEEPPCPFGPGWCGTGNPCPLHDGFVELERQSTEFLEGTTLAVFEG